MPYSNSEIDNTIFQLLKVSLLFEDEPVELDDWESVFAEMKKQTVASLPGNWLKKNPVSNEWSLFCVSQQAQWVRVMFAQDQLLKLLESNHIPCVIIKGTAASFTYPHPSLRAMGDVDFLVKRTDFQKTALLLEQNGYILEHEKNDRHHHYGYRKDDISFELHKRLGIISEKNERLIALFEEGIDHREFHEIEGFSFPTLPVDLNGLVLIFHIDQHMREGLGLRQIIDWMMYVDQLPQDIWEERVLPLLEETGLERLAFTVTVMCQKYFGLRKIIEDADYPCDELMDYIMEKGNFGRKAGAQGKNESVFLAMNNPSAVISRLQAGGMNRWIAAKKHRILRPFAWIYQVFRIVGILIRSKMTPKRFAEQHRNGLEHRALIEKLGLNVNRQI